MNVTNMSKHYKYGNRPIFLVKRVRCAQKVRKYKKYGQDMKSNKKFERRSSNGV